MASHKTRALACHNPHRSSATPPHTQLRDSYVIGPPPVHHTHVISDMSAPGVASCSRALHLLQVVSSQPGNGEGPGPGTAPSLPAPSDATSAAHAAREPAGGLKVRGRRAPDRCRSAGGPARRRRDAHNPDGPRGACASSAARQHRVGGRPTVAGTAGGVPQEPAVATSADVAGM